MLAFRTVRTEARGFTSSLTVSLMTAAVEAGPPDAGVAAMAVVVFVPVVWDVVRVVIPDWVVEVRITSAVVCTFLRFFCCWSCWLAETDLLLYSRLFCVRVAH